MQTRRIKENKKQKKERFTQSGAEQTSLDENNISNKAKKVKKSWYIDSVSKVGRFINNLFLYQ